MNLCHEITDRSALTTYSAKLYFWKKRVAMNDLHTPEGEQITEFMSFPCNL